MADRLVTRRSLAQLSASPRTATEILTEQNLRRIQRLVPMRFERMLASPFAFFRGSAAVMAADLAAGPSSDIEVLCCGDAHLSNFGVYAAPDRALLFDLNDFDEVAFAPAEWDVKRLATSVVVAGRHSGDSERSIDATLVRALATYQRSLRQAVKRTPVERYYRRVEPDRVTGGAAESRVVIEQVTRKARTKTSERAFAKLVDIDPDGRAQLLESPVLQRLDPAETADAEQLWEAYLGSVPIDVAYLLSQYTIADVALRIVGVGSVGTRCLLAVFLGPRGAPLMLQIKEASPSVLVDHGDRPQPARFGAFVTAFGEGARVVGGQRIMQASSDVFLGSFQHDGHDYYVRQFHDMKGSAEVDQLTAPVLADYASACAAVLAAAHARSPNAAEFSAYLGKSSKAPAAIGSWSYTYADKVSEDYAALQRAHAAGLLN